MIDAANVIGSRPDGWWKDRPGAARRLHRTLIDAAFPMTSSWWCWRGAPDRALIARVKDLAVTVLGPRTLRGRIGL